MEFYENRISKYRNFDINSIVKIQWYHWSDNYIYPVIIP